MKKSIKILLIVVGVILFILPLAWLGVVIYTLNIGMGTCYKLDKLAIENNDLSYCEKYPNICGVEGCYYLVALKATNNALCGQLAIRGSPQLSELCKAIYTGNPNNCLAIGRDYIYDCLTELKDNINSVSTCENVPSSLKKIGPIINFSVKSYCLDTLYFNFWSERQPIDLDLIDVSQCVAISEVDDVGITKDYCYRVNAIQDSSIDYCYNISGESDRLGCILEIALDKQDVGICDLLAEEVEGSAVMESLIEDCYIPIAGLTGNVEICNKISQDWLKKKCISSTIT